MFTESIEEDIKRTFIVCKKLADNAMLTHRPDLFDEWDFEKNDELGLDVYKVTRASGKKAWWVCHNGHSYIKKIANKVNGIGCPICSNKEISIGFNDMWTTNPNLAYLLADPEDGYKYTQGSKNKVNWKCPDCKSLVTGKAIHAIKRQGLSCGICSDGIDYPEKFMSYLLKQLGSSYFHDNSMEWSNNKRYDFYLPEIKCIIETHGDQHKRKTHWSRGEHGEHENDFYKKELAIKNGIKFYIEIDCEKSEMNFMKTSILNSQMKDLFDLTSIDWVAIEENCSTSAMIAACEMFNNGFKIFEISKVLKLNRNAISRYLTKGNNIGLCFYVPTTDRRRKIVQLDMENNLVKTWNSIKNAGDHVKISSATIAGCCNGKRKTAAGYKWLYFEEYNSYLKGISIPASLKNLHGCSVSVVKLDLNGNLLDEYDSIKIAAKENRLKSYTHITNCCKGHRKTAYGFKWMYKEDYDKNKKAI